MTANPLGSTSADTSRALPRGLLDFVTELSVALHKHTIYPAGHPLIAEAVTSLLARLESILGDRAALAIGVTPNQLIISGTPTDASNAMARDFAAKLHRRDIGAVKFMRGIPRDELAQALAALVRERLGDGEHTWTHVRIFPLTYDQLHLEEDEPDPAPGAADPAGGLWLDLARSALEQDGRSETEVLTDPLLVARAIEARKNDKAYDAKVVDYLTEFSRAAKAEGSADAVAGRRFVSAMVGALSPETIGRLLELKPDGAERREFIVKTSQVVSVEAVVRLVQAAADASDNPMSPALLRLYSKLAAGAGRGTAPARAAAEESLRGQVADLVGGWSLPGDGAAGPDEYRAVVAAAAGRGDSGARRAYRSEPERIIQMSLELGCPSALADAAADEMIALGAVPRLVELLDSASEGSQALSALRRRVVSPETVRTVVERRPLDFDALRVLADALWNDAAPPLLDALANEDDRTVRRRLLELLSGLGASIGPQVAARVTGPWYVQRNMLALLNSLPGTPEGFDAAPLLKHEDTRVRQEAAKLLVRDPVTRDRTICEALAGNDDRVLQIGLNAAAERCPPAAASLLARRLTDATLDATLQPLAVRALAQSGTATGLDCLTRLCVTRSRILRRERLASKSPTVLAALAALSSRWRSNPRAASVLAMAADHSDPDIRGAVKPDALETAS